MCHSSAAEAFIGSALLERRQRCGNAAVRACVRGAGACGGHTDSALGDSGVMSLRSTWCPRRGRGTTTSPHPSPSPPDRRWAGRGGGGGHGRSSQRTIGLLAGWREEVLRRQGAARSRLGEAGPARLECP